MENPNSRISTSTLRRHKSAPSTLRRRSTFLALRRKHQSSTITRSDFLHKSNPYVGWFRYSPAYIGASKEQQLPAISVCNRNGKRTANIMRTSPYVGWFPHAPPSSQAFLSPLKDLLFLLQMTHGILNMLSKDVPAVDKFPVIMLSDLLSGHLKGGGGGNSLYRDSSLPWSSEKSTSGTVKVLSRLACWFLYPFHLEDGGMELRQGCCSVASKEDDENSECTSCCDENDDESTMGSDDIERANSPYGSSSSISSQAEAYYAHQAAKELLDDPEYVEEEAVGLDRLDYVITQMDILRMNRTASRHLDVESILKLPIITYENSEKEETAIPEPRIEQADPEGWSWMMVHDADVQGDEQQRRDRPLAPKAKQQRKREQDVCVICLEHFRPGDRLRLLPCNHSFHVGCIDRWLSGSHSFDHCDTSGCPTCKKRPDLLESEQGATAMTSDVAPLWPQEQQDGSVPSWAFARIGNALARQTAHHF